MKKSFVMLGLLMASIVLLAACGSKSYEMDREVNIEFEGYDKHGEALITIDKGSLLSNLKSELNYKNNNDVIELERVISNLEVTATPNENLKNDDEIKLKPVYDEDNSIKLTLSLEEPKITVKNLEPIIVLSKEDIFASVEIKYEGISPFLKVMVVDDSNTEASKLFDYTIANPKETYKIGEKVEVIAEPKTELLDKGYETDEADYSNTIDIPEQRKYAQSWADLNKEDQAYVLDEFQDFVESKVDKMEGSYVIYDRGKTATVSNFVKELGDATKEEAYFLFVKEENYDDLRNSRNFAPSSIRIPYKNTVTTEKSILDKYSDDTYDYYTIVGAEPLIVDENDELVRAEMEISTFGKHEMHKETVANANIHIEKENFSVEEIKFEE